jgi:hypothetical protein
MKAFKYIGITAAVGAGAALAMRFFRQHHAISLYGVSAAITGGSRGLGSAIARTGRGRRRSQHYGARHP